MAIRFVKDILENEGRPVGSSCVSPDECMSGLCISGKCVGSLGAPCSSSEIQRIQSRAIDLQLRLDKAMELQQRCLASVCEQASGIASQARRQFEIDAKGCCDGDNFSDHNHIQCVEDSWDEAIDRFNQRISNQCQFTPLFADICEAGFIRVAELNGQVPACPNEVLCPVLKSELHTAESDITQALANIIFRRECSSVLGQSWPVSDIAICDFDGYRLLDLIEDTSLSLEINCDPDNPLVGSCDTEEF
jgi:hypothetical protein